MKQDILGNILTVNYNVNIKNKIVMDSQYKYWNQKTVLPWIKHDEDMNYKFKNITNILFNEINFKKGERVLDVGCGSGFTSFYISKKVGNKGSVLGLDISKPLIRLNKKKYKKNNNIYVMNKNIQNKNINLDNFDHVISRFGVMFFSNPVEAFTNIYKSLKKGGDFTFVCWTNFKYNQFHFLPANVVKKTTKIDIPFVDNSPGPFAFHERSYLSTILKRSYFKNFTIKNIKTTLKTKTLNIDTDIMLNIGTGARMIKENNLSQDKIKIIKFNLKKKLSKHIFSKLNFYKANIFLVKAYK